MDRERDRLASITMVELKERESTIFDDILGRSHAGYGDLRLRGREAFLRLGIPTTKWEDWKYTSLRDLTEHNFGTASRANVSATQLDALEYSADSIRIAIVNGKFERQLSRHLNAGGIRIETEFDQLGDLIEIEKNPFAALNTAAFDEAIVIHIDRNSVVEKPIEIISVTTGEGSPVAVFPRLVIVAESGSEATITETYASLGSGTTLQVPVVEVFIHANATIEHIRAQRETIDAFHVSVMHVRQERDSTYRHFSVTYGGHLTRNDTNVFLNGSNLHCRLDGIYVLSGVQHCDNHTRLDHAFPHCDSFEVYKGVLDDHAHGVFNGQIYVHQDAQKTDAKQTNQAILLSPTATIDTKPQLEIFADDVKCTHGATIGRLSQDALFYLRSRGICEAEARSILIYAFAAEVLEKIESDPARVTLERLLFEKLAR